MIFTMSCLSAIRSFRFSRLASLMVIHRNRAAKSEFCVLTNSAAHQLVGNDNPIGKQILMWRQYTLRDPGAIEDFPGNFSIDANMIVSMEHFKFSSYIGNDKDSSTYRYWFKIYLQRKENPIQSRSPTRSITILNS